MKARITYRLSRTGQVASLKAGGTGAVTQHAEGELEAEDLDLLVFPHEWAAPGDGTVEARLSAAIAYDAPQGVADIVADLRARRREVDARRVGFNWWALLFGPFWFFAKGLWLKGMMWIGTAVLAGILAGLILRVVWPGPVLVWTWAATTANNDLYRRSLAKRHALARVTPPSPHPPHPNEALYGSLYGQPTEEDKAWDEGWAQLQAERAARKRGRTR